MADKMLSRQEAVEVVRQRYNTSVGKAEKIIEDALSSGEVRAVDYEGIIGVLISHDDLISWLDRKHPTEEQIRQATERHWITYEQAIAAIRDHHNCPEGWAIKKLDEAEASGAVQSYRPPPPDYSQDKGAVIYNENDLRYWLDRNHPVAAAPAPAVDKRAESSAISAEAPPPSDKDLKGFVAGFIEKTRADGKTPTKLGLWNAAKDSLPGATRSRLRREFGCQVAAPRRGRPRKKAPINSPEN
jgi:hypothetical protein